MALPELVSRRQNLPDPAGAAGNTILADVSEDGRRLLWLSDAPNLVSPRLAAGVNLYLHDRESGATALITSGVDGGGADGPTLLASFLPGDARVIFESRARNLTSIPVTGAGDLYVYEIATGLTRLISVNRLGTAGGNGRSHSASVTPDGGYVAFVSQASDLVTQDGNSASDIFRQDLNTQSTELVTVSWSGSGSAAAAVRPPLDASHSPSMSEDGRYVAFASVAEMLRGTPLTGRPQQVYVRDFLSGRTLLISVNVNGQPPSSGDSKAPVIAGGRVYFLSTARDLTSESLATTVLYARPIEDGATSRISASPGTARREAGAFQVAADGTLVAYAFGGGAPWVPNGVRLWNGSAGTDTPITLNTSGESPVGMVRDFQLANDGTRLAFLSAAADLVPGGVGGRMQVYLADTQTGQNRWISQPTAPADHVSREVLNLTASDDLAVVGFSTRSADLVPGDSNGAVDVFAWDAVADDVELLSRGVAGESPETPAGPSGLEVRAVTADGRYVLFTAMADDLVESDANGGTDVFLRDRLEGVNQTISATAAGRTGNRWSWGAVMTPDARWVAFFSRATDLTDGDANADVDVYLRDVERGRTLLVSRNLSGHAAGGVTWRSPLVLSQDGRWIGFVSTAADLVEDDAGTSPDLFVRDLHAGTTYRMATASGTVWGLAHRPLWVTTSGRVLYLGGTGPGVWSVDPGSTAATERVGTILGLPALAEEGRWLAYVAPTEAGSQAIRLLDVATAEDRELLGAQPGLVRSAEEVRLSLSADGGRVALDTPAGLVPADANQRDDVYVLDRANPGVPRLASVTGSGAAVGNSSQARLSADGRWVVFKSSASNLVGGDRNGSADIYARDLERELTWVVSVSALAQETGAGWSFDPLISQDGGTVVFVSDAGDLAGRDWNAAFDLFAWQTPTWTEGDQDGDGLADSWEAAHFGGYHRDGSGDADGDGTTDRTEFKAGTDPIDAESIFALAFRVAAGIGTLEWPGTPDRQYQVEFRFELESGGWEPLPGAPDAAEPGVMRQTDLSFPGDSRRWFRVRVAD